MNKARAEIASSRHALSGITNKLQKTTKQRDCAHQQAHKTQQKLEVAIADSVYSEE